MPQLLKDLDFPPEVRQKLRDIAQDAKNIFEERHGKIGGEGAQLLPSALLDTPAMLLLRRRSEKAGEHIQPVRLQYEGEEEVETFYVQRLSQKHIMEVGGILNRAGFSMEHIDTEEGQEVWFQAILYVALVKGENDTGRYFEDISECEVWFGDPAMTEMVDALLGAVMVLNPRLIVGSGKKKVQVHLG